MSARPASGAAEDGVRVARRVERAHREADDDEVRRARPRRGVGDDGGDGFDGGVADVVAPGVGARRRAVAGQVDARDGRDALGRSEERRQVAELARVAGEAVHAHDERAATGTIEEPVGPARRECHHLSEGVFQRQTTAAALTLARAAPVPRHERVRDERGRRRRERCDDQARRCHLHPVYSVDHTITCEGVWPTLSLNLKLSSCPDDVALRKV